MVFSDFSSIDSRNILYIFDNNLEEYKKLDSCIINWNYWCWRSNMANDRESSFSDFGRNGNTQLKDM